ncbi:MAG: hypothetical protein JOZ53_25910 [Planctomycetaceae bacterium]|nr:hypothetical protein [Planctomycetaceae bacterium]
MCKTHENDVRRTHRCSCPECCREPDGAVAREHQAINRIIACTDERSRRLVAGLLARLYGHGGITRLARITGLDRNTIARGRRKLDRADALPPGRVRCPGAGPKHVETRCPES